LFFFLLLLLKKEGPSFAPIQNNRLSNCLLCLLSLFHVSIRKAVNLYGEVSIKWCSYTVMCVLCTAWTGEVACADGDALSGDKVSGTPVHSGTSQDHRGPERVPGEAEHSAGRYREAFSSCH
jgi:hypothetical protein